MQPIILTAVKKTNDFSRPQTDMCTKKW